MPNPDAYFIPKSVPKIPTTCRSQRPRMIEGSNLVGILDFWNKVVV